MILVKTKYTEKKYNPETKILTSEWLWSSAKMSNSEFKKELKALIQLATILGADSIISDTRKMVFVMTPDLQYWYSEKVVPILSKIGIQKKAFIIGEIHENNKSIEPILDEGRSVNQLSMRFFTGNTEALTWLNTNYTA